GRLRAEIGRSATRLAEQRAALADGEQRLGAAPPGHADALARLGERRLAAAAACERLARERAEVQRATAEASDVLTHLRQRAERERTERGAAALAAHRARDELTRLARDLAEFTEDEQVLDWADQPQQLRLRLEELPGWASEPTVTPDPESLRKRMLQLQRELRAIGGVSASALEVQLDAEVLVAQEVARIVHRLQAHGDRRAVQPRAHHERGIGPVQVVHDWRELPQRVAVADEAVGVVG